MKYFKLSPGQGGDQQVVVNGILGGMILGGGGGGVLVNRQGPQQRSNHQGLGYGGGGSDYLYPKENHIPLPDGLPGVVLVEVVPLIP